MYAWDGLSLETESSSVVGMHFPILKRGLPILYDFSVSFYHGS